MSDLTRLPTAGRFRVGPAGGAGTPLVLLPGIEGDPGLFSRLAGLAADREVEAWPLPVGPNLPNMADALVAALPDRVCLLGVSLGGLVAWEAACRAPGRVAALVTLGSLPDPRFRPRGLALAASILDHVPPRVAAARYRARIRARHVEEGVDPAWSVPLLGNLPEPSVLVDRLRAVARWHPTAPPPVPTLWLRGQVDHEVSWSIAEAATCLPGVTVQTVPGGHRAPLSHPGALVAVVRSFLRSA